MYLSPISWHLSCGSSGLILAPARVAQTSGKSALWEDWHFCAVEGKDWDYGRYLGQSSLAPMWSSAPPLPQVSLSYTVYSLDDDSEDSNDCLQV